LWQSQSLDRRKHYFCFNPLREKGITGNYLRSPAFGNPLPSYCKGTCPYATLFPLFAGSAIQTANHKGHEGSRRKFRRREIHPHAVVCHPESEAKEFVIPSEARDPGFGRRHRPPTEATHHKLAAQSSPLAAPTSLHSSSAETPAHPDHPARSSTRWRGAWCQARSRPGSPARKSAPPAWRPRRRHRPSCHPPPPT